MGKNILKSANSNADVISLFINLNPELKGEIDLPVQGESVKPYGKLIVDNQRYKNMFINTVNLIGITVIKENRWENPWQSLTDKGMLRYGQQIREVIQDLAKVFDYNKEYPNKTKFLGSFVPDVYQYMHEINFQKVWATTINESELLMAFEDEENGLVRFIENCISNLYETYDYDKWLVDKYQLCRRILDGTIPVKKITATDPRDILAEMKAVSNKMTFKSPYYNPAGVRRATRHEDQYLMLDASREAITSTNVLATSYFLNEAETKTNLALIDSFSDSDDLRLAELLEDQYTPFTDAEKLELATVMGLIVSRDFFMDYHRALDMNPDVNGKRQTSWENPTTLDRNIFLHAQECISTSPFANACVFTSETPSITSVSVSPSTATVTKGQTLQLSAEVATVGFANKAVTWEINDQAVTSGATITESGLLKVPSGYTTENGTQGVYNLTVSTALATDEYIYIDGVKYTAAAAADTAAKQATAIYTQLAADSGISAHYTVTNPSSGVVRFTEKSGYYGIGAPEVDDDDLTTGVVTMATGTAGKQASSPILVTATSVYDDSKSADALITVS